MFPLKYHFLREIPYESLFSEMNIKPIIIDKMDNSKIKHVPSGEVYENRKEAKVKMGHGNFNRALKNGEIFFLKTYGPTDIIL